MAYKRILVAVDGSDISVSVLNEAVSLSKAVGATVRIISVADEYMGYAEGIAIDLEAYARSIREHGKQILKQMETLAVKAGVTPEIHLIEVDKQADVIPEKIVEDADHWKADVIVLGTHGRRGISRMLLGSVAESVVRLASKPVLLVKGQSVKQ